VAAEGEVARLVAQDDPASDDDAGWLAVGSDGFLHAALPTPRGTHPFGDAFSEHVAARRCCDDIVHGPERVPGLHARGSTLASFGEDEADEPYPVYPTGRCCASCRRSAAPRAGHRGRERDMGGLRAALGGDDCFS
jgi:hypothetical protein